MIRIRKKKHAHKANHDILLASRETRRGNVSGTKPRQTTRSSSFGETVTLSTVTYSGHNYGRPERERERERNENPVPTSARKARESPEFQRASRLEASRSERGHVAATKGYELGRDRHISCS